VGFAFQNIKETTMSSESTMTINEVGAKEWRNSKGELHRLDGPAIESKDNGNHWYRNGKSHREDGPACEYSDGNKFWYKNGLLHRTDGPAIECASGHKEWYIGGVLHRVNGPAIEHADGETYEWYFHGEPVTKPFIMGE